MERRNLALLCAGVVCFWLFALAFGTAQGTVREHLRQRRAGHERHRDSTAQTIHHEDRQREQETIFKLGDLPCVTECLEHLTSPQPFRLPSRFSLWQKRNRLRP